ncbi:MAG: NAD(P)-dependent oxidoreductase [Bacteroidales bacterium]|nr:NAD(P)-dependent oxidoreductase [Bacteroidales bacterium]
MKVALIGASGFVGTAILNELVQRDHQVTAIVRHPEKVKQAKQVRIIKANVLNENEVTEAVKGHDVVVSAYNAGWTNPNLYNEFLEGSKAIQAGVKKSGVKRLIVIGGAGSLYVAEGVQMIDTPQFPENIKPGASAARDYLNILRDEKELDWTFFSPAIEMHQGTSGERKGTYRTGLDNPVFDKDHRSVLSVEDLAVVIADEAENPKHIRQRFTAAY